jgi:biopolymer transport protein ExbD
MRLSSRKAPRGRKIELSMTSMIDVVFLLLIFFMTTASFVKTERDLDSAIEVRGRASRQEPRDLEPAVVDVARGLSGYVYKLGEREIADRDELTRLLRGFELKADGAFVRVSDGAPFRMAAAAVQACKSAGFPVVSYLPTESKGGR